MPRCALAEPVWCDASEFKFSVIPEQPQSEDPYSLNQPLRQFENSPRNPALRKRYNFFFRDNDVVALSLIPIQNAQDFAYMRVGIDADMLVVHAGM